MAKYGKKIIEIKKSYNFLVKLNCVQWCVNKTYRK